jgi:hypothetical protein
MPSGTGNESKLIRWTASRRFWITILAVPAAVGILAGLLIDPFAHNRFVAGRRKDKLIGEWRTEPVTWNHPMNTNHVAFYTTVTFSEDRAFKMQTFMNSEPRQEMPMRYQGFYRVLNTNRMVLEIAPDASHPTNTIPLTVDYTLIGNELTLPELNSSVVATRVTYHKAKD